MEKRLLWLQLKVTLWKCWRSRTHNVVFTIATILLPILLYAFVVWYYSSVGVVYVKQDEPTVGSKTTIEDLDYNLNGLEYLYSPASNFTDKLIRRLQLDFEYPNNAIHSFPSEPDMMEFHKRQQDFDNFLISFEATKNAVPDEFVYKIRMLASMKRLDNLYYEIIKPGAGLDIYRSFVALQMHLNKYYMDELHLPTDNIQFTMEEFPFPPYTDDQSDNNIFIIMFPLFTCIAFSLVGPYVLLQIVHEKECGIKEYMKMMGLSPKVMWMSWFLENLLIITVPVTFVVVLLTVPFGKGAVLLCNPAICFAFLLLYNCANVSLCYVVASFSSNGVIALITYTVFTILTFIMCMVCYTDIVLGQVFKYLLCLIPNGSLIFGYYSIRDHEKIEGVNFGNLFATYNSEVESLGFIFLILIAETIAFLALANYIDSINPGKYGIPKRWTHPFMPLARWIRKRFWSGNEVCANQTNLENNDECLILNMQSSIMEQCKLKTSVEIDNLSKEYGGRLAVDHLSMKIYEGEIMALLGPNGAGKTTTMSIITGMINQTGGTVKINGLDLQLDLDRIRSILGICPQEDLLFQSLTVREHLLFIAKLNSVEDADAKVEDMLKLLSLTNHANYFPPKISGGMKRKVCFGMALISDPKVVILDEPTSGLDPMSRRQIWNILRKWRSSHQELKTILLSTHQLEEAEELADRITILDKGTLRAQGTLTYLREKQNVPYDLHILYKESGSEKGKEKVKNLKRGGVVPIAEPKAMSRNLEYYDVRTTDKAKIMELLKNLEKVEEIQDVTVNSNSLDRLFCQFTNNSFQDEPDSSADATAKKPNANESGRKYTGWTLHKAKTIFKLRWFAFKNSICTYLTFVVPIVVLLIMGLLLARPSIVKYTAKHHIVDMELKLYGPTTVFFSGPRDNELVARAMDEYGRLVEEQQSTAVEVPSAKNALLELGARNILEYAKRAVAAAEFDVDADGRVAVNVLYSELAVHAPPIALNLAWNAVLRAVANGTERRIDVVSQPIRLSNFEANNVMAYMMIVCLFLGFSFWITYFAGYPLTDRRSGLKHLELMTGVHISQYWFILYVFDVAVYLVTLAALMAVGVLCFNPVFGTSVLLGLFWHSAVFGATGIVFSYILSIFASRFAAYSACIINCTFVTLLCIAIAFVLESTEQTTRHVFDLASRLIPMYRYLDKIWIYVQKVVWNWEWDGMPKALKTNYCRANTSPCCLRGQINDGSAECEAYKIVEVVSWTDAVYLIAIIAFYSSIIIFLYDNIYVSLRRAARKRDGDEEEAGDDIVQCVDIRKSFAKNNPVLNNLNIKVKKGTCCGVLAPNGSGKTTTFEMLARKQGKDKGGSITINGINYDHLYDYMVNIGYCPQYNALNGDLTAEELLQIFAELREIPEGEQRDQVAACIRLVGLSEFAAMRCGQYSGGNKRKLCIALAMIGAPKLMLLDEPTTGVDPISRRAIWNALKSKYTAGQSILLTSHSMAECEFLCSSLAFMKDGRIELPKSIDSLKSEYGEHFMIEIKLGHAADEVDAPAGERCSVVRRVKDSFEEAFRSFEFHVKDESVSHIAYCIKKGAKQGQPAKRLSQIYERMQQLYERNSALITDYDIKTATLEEAFLAFSSDYSKVDGSISAATG